MNRNLPVHDLLVSQEYLRNEQQVSGMIDYLQSGKRFDKCKPLVSLSRFEDDKIAILDGHHRTTAVFLSRGYLLPEEYTIQTWSYDDFKEIGFLDEYNKWLGWVTPLNFLTENRITDFGKFKAHVKDIYYNQSPQHAIHYILTHKELYSCHRSISTVQELAEKYEEKRRKSC